MESPAFSCQGSASFDLFFFSSGLISLGLVREGVCLLWHSYPEIAYNYPLSLQDFDSLRFVGNGQ